MAEYIERGALRKLMYEEAFEKDSDMQRWDSGCWIRYKLFENCIEAIPAADVVEVVRCKDCKYGNSVGVEYRCEKHSGHKNMLGEDAQYSEYHSAYWYCADGMKE